MSDDSSFPALLERAAAGDERAAGDLIRHYEGELRRYIRFRMTDLSMRRFLDSMDVCQSVLANFFLQLQGGKLDLSDPARLMQLLRVMARNKIRDKHRRDRAARRGGEQRAAEGVAPDLLPDRNRSVSEQLAAGEIVQAVREKLPEDERSLLERWMNGDDWERIAADRSASPEALRKRLSRAIDRAAAELGLIQGES